MSTNYQTARIALGTRLREMRVEADLSGRELADALGWAASKVSKIERGNQTPTNDDVTAWAAVIGREDAITELTARLRALETHYASWRRQLAAGTRANQEAWALDEQKCTEFRNFEPSCVPGLLQTPEYARHMLTLVTDLYHTPQDVEAGVNARIQRQQALYEPGRRFHFLIWEAALHLLICPPEAMATQLDRLVGVVGLTSITVGIIPLGAGIRVPPFHSFVLYDDVLVRVETLGAELRLVDQTEVGTYREIWNRLDDAAAYGPQAHRVIGRARAALNQTWGNDHHTDGGDNHGTVRAI